MTVCIKCLYFSSLCTCYFLPKCILIPCVYCAKHKKKCFVLTSTKRLLYLARNGKLYKVGVGGGRQFYVQIRGAGFWRPSRT